ALYKKVKNISKLCKVINKKTAKEEQEEKKITSGLFRIFFVIFSIIASIFLIAAILRLWDYYLHRSAPTSALEYYIMERDFLEKYAMDKDGGGFVYWVERDGNVVDDKKYSIFQANMILWLGGLESQYHDDKNIEMVKSAADYLVKYLYKGNGEWYDYDLHSHRTKRDFFWNPRSETYIAQGLFHAYRLTKNERYLVVAQQTTAALMQKNPDGIIHAEFDPAQDIGFRFPEHMAFIDEYRLTSNTVALDYVRLFDANYGPRFAKEVISEDGQIFFYHGTSVIDKLLYGFLDDNTKAYEEASTGREFYWSMMFDEAKPFNVNVPGESSDNGRDYYDKRLAMDLIEWTKRNEEVYRDDAKDMWGELKRFWDVNKPYGFYVNTSETRKTCFTIGMPQPLMDLTGPEVISWDDSNLALWNHQATVVVRDTENYVWNDITFRGIGLNSPKFKFRPILGFMYGKPTLKEGPCEGCVTYDFNFVSLFPGRAKVYNEDYFGNKSWNDVPSQVQLAIRNWSNLNSNSIMYYFVLFIAALVIFLISAFIWLFVFFKRRKTEDFEEKKVKKAEKDKINKK
ncbi:AGE family epimerase/isomerase, partial [Patescibacteria group bacterium]|nr:AGE family epimerase/isomerase [Patescibacteria group bacterium]